LRAEWRAAKETFVPNQVAFDLFDSSGGYGIDDRPQDVGVIPILEPLSETWITPPIHDEVAAERARLVRPRGGIKRRLDAEFRPEPVEGESAGEEFRVRGGLEEFAGVVFEKCFSGVERNDLYAPGGGGEALLVEMRREVGAQVVEVCRGSSSQPRENQEASE